MGRIVTTLDEKDLLTLCEIAEDKILTAGAHFGQGCSGEAGRSLLFEAMSAINCVQRYFKGHESEMPDQPGE